MNTYRITLSTDQGPYRILVTAQDEDTARKMVIDHQHCPERAIKKTELIIKTLTP